MRLPLQSFVKLMSFTLPIRMRRFKPVILSIDAQSGINLKRPDAVCIREELSESVSCAAALAQVLKTSFLENQLPSVERKQELCEQLRIPVDQVGVEQGCLSRRF